MRTRPCKKCQRAILLVRTKATGAWMPLDPEPTPYGNVALDSQERAVVLGAGGNLAGELTYRPHFATCPVHKREQKRGEQLELGL